MPIWSQGVTLARLVAASIEHLRMCWRWPSAFGQRTGRFVFVELIDWMRLHLAVRPAEAAVTGHD